MCYTSVLSASYTAFRFIISLYQGSLLDLGGSLDESLNDGLGAGEMT